MIQIEPLTWLLVLEALGVVSAFAVVGIWLLSRRRNQEKKAVKQLIERLKKVESGQSQELGEILAEIQDLPQERRQILVDEIMEREKALYRQILKLFLERDISLLSKVDEGVRDITRPYQELLRDLPAGKDPELTAALAQAEGEISRLKAETQQLSEQLQVAMETVDNLSKEYTRMFAPDKTTEEMEASRHRILETLKQNENRLARHPVEEPPGETAFDDDDLIITVTDS